MISNICAALQILKLLKPFTASRTCCCQLFQFKNSAKKNEDVLFEKLHVANSQTDGIFHNYWHIKLISANTYATFTAHIVCCICLECSEKVPDKKKQTSSAKSQRTKPDATSAHDMKWQTFWNSAVKMLALSSS